MSRWFRHYAGMMRDDKLVRVAIRSGQTIERVVWIWGAILESAAEIDDNGQYDLDAAEVTYFLRTSEDDIEAVLAALTAVGRINEGVVVKWSDRQFQSDRSAERQKLYRERKKLRVAGVPSDDTKLSDDAEVTSLSRHSDAPETETETEVSEPKGSSPSRLWACPPDVVPNHWRDFMRNRRTRHMTNSETAYQGQIRALQTIADDEWPPGRLVRHAAEKGWGTICDPRKPRHGQSTGIGKSAAAFGMLNPGDEPF